MRKKYLVPPVTGSTLCLVEKQSIHLQTVFKQCRGVKNRRKQKTDNEEKKSTNLFSGPEVKAVTRPSFGSMVLLALNKKNRLKNTYI